MKSGFLFTVILLSSLAGSAQQKVTGRVIDQQTNDPIAGASVMLRNGIGVATNYRGEFTLTADTGTITVTSIGYATKQTRISGTNPLIMLQPSNTALNEVMVEGNGNKRKILQTANAIGLITTKDLQRTSGIHLHQALNLLPGVKMEIRTTTSGARIVLRGYGNETNFNGAGYKAYLNGIPVTDADGTTFLDDIDFFNLGRVEVIKGPSSSLYGNGIGGVVLMQLQKSEPGETSITQHASGGSYGLFRTNTSYKTSTENSNLFLNYGHQQYEGFRLHSSSKKDFVNLGGDFYLGSKRTISTFASYTKSYDYLAGQVDSNYLYLHPDTAETGYLVNNAHVNTENVKLSVSQDYRFSDHFSNQSVIFLTGSTLDQPSAAGLSRLAKFKYGGRSVFSYAPAAWDKRIRMIGGTEFIRNRNFSKNYTLANGMLAGMRSDQEITATQYNIFLQAEANITSSTTLLAGAAENFLEYDFDDMIASRPASSPQGLYKNQSGYRRFTPIFSPKISLIQMAGENISVYANWSKGFSSPATSQIMVVPTGAALSTQDPQLNINLKPETATSYEIGSKGSLVSKQFSYDIAFFLMNVKDKLVTEFYGGNSYTYTTNAGDARHKGVELSLSYAKQYGGDQFISLLKPFLSYTYTDFEYVHYKTIPQGQTSAADLSGFPIPGNVKHLFNAGFDVESNSGLYLNSTFSYVDRMPVYIDRYQDIHYANAYHLLNGRMGFRKALGQHINLDIYGGMDNITGSVYATHIFLNSRDYPKVYNPMPKETWYAGVTAKYRL